MHQINRLCQETTPTYPQKKQELLSANFTLIREGIVCSNPKYSAGMKNWVQNL